MSRKADKVEARRQPKGLQAKNARWGVVFLLPWMLGAAVFFLVPLGQTVWYSLNNAYIEGSGVTMEYIGLSNYVRAFTSDAMFNRLLITMVTESLPRVLIVVIFSLLVAVLINGKFPLRNVARTVFFIPIIMGTSIADAHIVGTDAISVEISGGGGMAFGAEFLMELLYDMGLPTQVVGYVSSAVTGIFAILAITGVPTLIFLAGLQSISPSLYEVARIEGSTVYETFWKVTLPMISPQILLCTVYSIIDTLARHKTVIDGVKVVFLDRLHDIAFRNNMFGLSAAMSVMYMLANLLIIGIVYLAVSKAVFYYD